MVVSLVDDERRDEEEDACDDDERCLVLADFSLPLSCKDREQVTALLHTLYTCVYSLRKHSERFQNMHTVGKLCPITN